MKNLKINFDEIQKAMEDVLRDTFDYFLDSETGEVIAFSDEILKEANLQLYDDDSEEFEDDIEYVEFDEEPELPDWMLDEIELALEILLDEHERYIHIPGRKSSVAYQSMSGFIETITDQDLKEEVSASLNGKGAFRKFKDLLINYPKERKRWHSYNAKTMKREIIEWLNSVGVKPIP